MMRAFRSAGHDGAAVTLGGRQWVLADLAPRQLRKVLPALASLAALKHGTELDEARIDRLIDAIYHALTRNYPDLTREEFLDLPVTTRELVAALPALAKAAGVERRADAPVEAPPGEACGAAARLTDSSIA